jgi:hypothetical protein
MNSIWRAIIFIGDIWIVIIMLIIGSGWPVTSIVGPGLFIEQTLY